MSDRLVRGWAGDHARVLIAEASGVAAETARRHGLDEAGAWLAAELVVANLLLAAWIKGEERSTLQVSADDVLFYGEVDAEGRLRARLRPQALGARRSHLTGAMLVLKYDATRELYRGTTSVRHATVEGALQRHLAQSEQVDAVVRVMVDERGARGMVVERMPGDDSEAWGPLRARAAHADPLDVIARARVGDAEVRWLEERPLTWRCRCSDEAVRGMLAGLGADALRELADEDHGAEITCHFCNEVRTLSEAELRALIPAGDA